MNTVIRAIISFPSYLVGYGIYGCVSVYPRVRTVQREFVDFTKFLGEALWKKYVGSLFEKPNSRYPRPR